MKTKNILLSVLALALIATPLLAQDYHEDEYKKDMGKIGASLAQTYKEHMEKKYKETYLDVGTLLNFIQEDIPVNLEKLLNKATNSINDNKITPQEQYELMIACIEGDENEILETLLKAGFDPEVDKTINENLQNGENKVISLLSKADGLKNKKAYDLLWDAYIQKMQIWMEKQQDIKTMKTEILN